VFLAILNYIYTDHLKVCSGAPLRHFSLQVHCRLSCGVRFSCATESPLPCLGPIAAD
jgi:hypothetical protein